MNLAEDCPGIISFAGLLAIFGLLVSRVLDFLSGNGRNRLGDIAEKCFLVTMHGFFGSMALSVCAALVVGLQKRPLWVAGAAGVVRFALQYGDEEKTRIARHIATGIAVGTLFLLVGQWAHGKWPGFDLASE